MIFPYSIIHCMVILYIYIFYSLQLMNKSWFFYEILTTVYGVFLYATVVENNVTRFSTDNENNIYLNIKLAKVQFIFNLLLKTLMFSVRMYDFFPVCWFHRIFKIIIVHNSELVFILLWDSREMETEKFAGPTTCFSLSLGFRIQTVKRLRLYTNTQR